MSDISKLILVSKVLYNEEIIRLNKELFELKKRKVWVLIDSRNSCKPEIKVFDDLDKANKELSFRIQVMAKSFTDLGYQVELNSDYTSQFFRIEERTVE